MSRAFRILVLLISAALAGCGHTVCELPGDIDSRIPPRDPFRVELSHLPDAQCSWDDDSTWQPTRYVARPGKDRLIIIERTSRYSDLDEDNAPIRGTLRDRVIERVWITIPKDTPWGKALKVEELEVEFFTGYEVNDLDSKGFFVDGCLMKGFIILIEERQGMLVVDIDLEVRPRRQFAENWKVEGRHTLHKSATVHMTKSRDVKLQVQETP